MSTFKIVLTAIFSICIVGAIAVFALSKTSSSEEYSNVLVWGTVSSEAFNIAYKNSSLESNKFIKVAYVQKSPVSFDSEFVEALAEGNGPDAVLLREDMVYQNRNKLFTLPYENYTARMFKDTFIEQGEMFLDTEGVVAVPFIVDPLVMYWNRDMFSNSLVSQPPQYWDEIYNLVPKLTKRDSNANILQSVVALGEWRNINNAKEIISNLLIQAGTPITMRSGGQVTSVLNSKFSYVVVPSQSAVNFYTQFSNPTSPAYSWNRSLPTSFNMFLSGNLSMYLGFASEIFSIQQKNANLNFDVTYVPQIRDSAKKTVFAHMYALAIVKQSKQIGATFLTLNALTEATALQALETLTNLPPVRRDLLATKPADAFRTVFYNSALMSKAWIDPNAAASSNAFRDMIESITSGKSGIGDALNQVDNALIEELR